MTHFWKNKKVLVTGAAGFVGSHVVEALLQKGAIVTAVISPETKRDKIKKNLYGQKIVIRTVNLVDRDECIDVVKGQQIVLNFAALDGGAVYKQKYPARIFTTNIQIVQNILEASRLAHVEKCMLMSSIEVYPENARGHMKEESGWTGAPNESTEGYAWSKRFSEIAGKMYYKEFGLPVIIVRAGNIYGPRDYAIPEKGRVIPTFIEKVLTGEAITIVGNGSQEKSFMYVTDFVEMLLSLIEKYDTPDPINIAGSVYLSIKDLAMLIGEVASRKVSLLYTKNTDPLGERIVDISKLKRLVSFGEKVSLKEGIAKTLDYVKKNS